MLTFLEAHSYPLINRICRWAFLCLMTFIPNFLEASEPASLDLKDWDGESILDLRGPWDFYWQKLIPPGDFEQSVPDAQALGSQEWNGIKLKDQSVVPSFGYATYRILLKNVKPKKLPLLVAMPTAGNSFRAWLYLASERSVIAYGESGIVGVGAQTSRPSKSSINLTFQLKKASDIEIIIQASNFDTHRGGLWSLPRLGNQIDILKAQNLDNFQGLVSLGIAIGLSTYLFMIWLRQRSLVASLWLALGSLACVLRILGTNSLTGNLFAEDFTVAKKFEYVSMPLGSLCLFNFFYQSFYKKNRRIKGHSLEAILPLIWNVISILLVSSVLTLPIQHFTVLLPAYQIHLILSFFLDIFLLYYGIKQRSPSVWFSAIGIISVIFGVIFDIVRSTLHYDLGFYLTPTMVALFLILQAQVIAQRNALAYREMHRLARELKDQEKARTLFFHNTSHELRTPLNGILGFLDLILKDRYGEINATAKKQITKVYHLAESLKFQVNTILDLAKTKRGELHLTPQSLPLERLITDIDQLAEGLVINLPAVTYNSQLTADSPVFLGDREKIFTILRNLLGNAIKFRDPKRRNLVSLTVSLLNHQLTLQIKDTGIGIPEEFREKVFEEFAQVQTDARRSYEGTGLGLAMVKDLVELMNGTLTLESEVGVGSCFTVTLPERTEAELILTPVQEATESPEEFAAPSEEHEVIPTASSSASEGEGKGWDIMVIDDNPINCEVISGLLLHDGYEVRTYERGAEGLQGMRAKRPDVLLLDMMMPEMSGEDVLKHMRADSLLQEIPVILITARASEEDRLAGLALGADDYLAKPIFAPELRLRLRNMTARHRLLRQSERSEQDDKIMQLGEMFGELSHELKNILHGSTSLKGLKAEDALLSCSVLSLEDEVRQIYAESLIAPPYPGVAQERMEQLEGRLSQGSEALERILRYSLLELKLTHEELRQVWTQFRAFSPEELGYAQSQLKLFLEHKQLHQTVMRSNQLTQSVLSYTREATAETQCLLSEVWEQCLALLHSRLIKMQVTWTVELPSLGARIPASQLMQILLNLVGNALDTIQGLPPELRWLKIETQDNETELFITISNAGNPIPRVIQDRLFQRGYTTKGAKGSGIGLYVSRRLAAQAGGELAYDSKATYPSFTLRLLRSP